MIFCLEKCKYQKDGECQKHDTLTNAAYLNTDFKTKASPCCHFVPYDATNLEPENFQEVKN